MKAIDRLYKYLEFKGLKPGTFEKIVGLSNGYLGKQFKRGADLGEGILMKIIENCPEVNPDWLIMGSGTMILEDKANMVMEPQENYIPLIPIQAMAGKGNGSFQIKKSDIIDGYLIPEFSEKGVEYIIRVSGSSMYPKYSSGDLLGCKTVKDLSFFQWGKVYVLDTDQGPMVKRLYPVQDRPECLECRSDNKEYPPFQISKDSIFKIAIVVGVLRLE